MGKLMWILLATLFLIQDSIQQCNITDEKVFILHGDYMRPANIMPITFCNSTAVLKDQPIKFEAYKEYLKMKEVYPSSKDEEKVRVLYSNTFSFLPDLKTLILAMIGLEVIEPKAFNNLGNLKYLNLEKNMIRTLPRGVFDDVPNLKILNLDENKLETVDEQLFDKLIHLTDLRLSMNELKELSGHWHTGLTQLNYLNLAGNQFEILKSEMFHGLINLDRLRLHSNRLGVIERDAFKGLLKLDSLTLEFNKNISTDLTQELQNLPRLAGVALSPYNFDCQVYQAAIEYLNEKKVEIVEIPFTSKCWKK